MRLALLLGAAVACVVGAVEVSRRAGYDKIIGFDMGGTSTDVTHYAGEYERAFVTEVAGALRMRLEYATDLFDADTIDRLIGHWQVLLAGIVADPLQPISRLPLMQEPERQRLLVERPPTRDARTPADRGRRAYGGRGRGTAVGVSGTGRARPRGGR